MRVWATMLRLRSVEGVFSTSKTKSGFLIMLIQNLRGTLLDFQEWTMCSVCSPPPAKATLLSKRSKSHLTAGGKDSSQVVLVVLGEPPPPRPLPPSLTVSMVVKKSSMNFLTVPLVERSLVRWQVWSPTQSHYISFLQSRISVNQCVFNKGTIKVCVSCC